MKSAKLVLLIVLAISLEKMVVSVRTNLLTFFLTMLFLIITIAVLEAIEKYRMKARIKAKMKVIKKLGLLSSETSEIALQRGITLALLQLVSDEIDWELTEKGESLNGLHK